MRPKDGAEPPDDCEPEAGAGEMPELGALSWDGVESAPGLLGLADGDTGLAGLGAVDVGAEVASGFGVEAGDGDKVGLGLTMPGDDGELETGMGAWD